MTHQRWMFTFGVGHVYKQKYVEIEALSIDEAREVMMEAHKDRWAMMYDGRDFEEQIRAYRYTRLALIRKNEFGHWRAE